MIAGAEMLPPGLHLGPVSLQIRSLERSIGYYRDLLGLRVLDSSGSTAVLGTHGESKPLVELRERTGARPAPLRGRLGLYHFALLLPDRHHLGRFARHLGERQVQFGASDHLVSEALYLRDPDGLGIEVYADRPRDEWRVRETAHGPELVMATDALDLDSLVRSGGAERWNGMPAGTIMGHVHLHVGDLEQASDFYHRALGFSPTVRSYSGALFLSAGGYHHHLGVNTWAGERATPATALEARLLRWTIALPSRAHIDAATERLRVAGYASEVDALGTRTTDPWGTLLLLTLAAPA